MLISAMKLRLDHRQFDPRSVSGSNHGEWILAEWVAELAVPTYRRLEVTGFAQDSSGVGIVLSDARSLRAITLTYQRSNRAAFPSSTIPLT